MPGQNHASLATSTQGCGAQASLRPDLGGCELKPSLSWLPCENRAESQQKKQKDWYRCPGCAGHFRGLAVGDVDFMPCAERQPPDWAPRFSMAEAPVSPCILFPRPRQEGYSRQTNGSPKMSTSFSLEPFTWQRGIKVTDGINVTNQKTLRRELVMDYPGGAGNNHKVLENGEVEERHRQGPLWKHGWGEAISCALKMKERCCEPWHAGASS